MPTQHEIPDCNANGVLGIVPGIIGNFQALEVVKMITGIGEVLSGKLFIYNGLTQHIQKIKFPKIQQNFNLTELKQNYEFKCAPVVQSIGSLEFWNLIKNERIQCIDVRTPREFDAFHLSKTYNIPVEEITGRLKEIQFDIPVYFLCQSGIRSQNAILKIQETNPKASLINVKGGINNLQAYVA